MVTLGSSVDNSSGTLSLNSSDTITGLTTASVIGTGNLVNIGGPQTFTTLTINDDATNLLTTESNFTYSGNNPEW